MFNETEKNTERKLNEIRKTKKKMKLQIRTNRNSGAEDYNN